MLSYHFLNPFDVSNSILITFIFIKASIDGNTFEWYLKAKAVQFVLRFHVWWQPGFIFGVGKGAVLSENFAHRLTYKALKNFMDRPVFVVLCI
jgi:hypothetical protein